MSGESRALQLAREFGFALVNHRTTEHDFEREWRRRFRLTQLVDRTDLYLYLLHGDRWCKRHVRVEGKWPEKGPFLALTHHWGTGLWGLVELGRAGHHVRALSRRMRIEEFGGSRSLLHYAKLRNRAVERATRAPMLPSGGAMPEIRDVLKAGQPLIALCDIPGWAASKAQARFTIQARLRDSVMTFPASLLRFACNARIPFVLFAGGFDQDSGNRWVRIQSAEVCTDPAVMAARLAGWLEFLLDRDPTAWHMWPGADQLLTHVGYDGTAARMRHHVAGGESLERGEVLRNRG